jgi:hypothetical protein
MSSTAAPLFCPDDGLVLHEAKRGVFVCHCRGALLVRDVFHRDARELLEPAPPRHTEPDLACPRCSQKTGLLRVGHKDRWPHWCENCGAIWLRSEDLLALAALRQERMEDREPEPPEGAWEEPRKAFLEALSQAFFAGPPEPESKWDPDRLIPPRRFSITVDGVEADDVANALVALINWLS